MTVPMTMPGGSTATLAAQENPAGAFIGPELQPGEMALATVRRAGTTSAVRLEGEQAIVLAALDVREVLERPDWRQWAADQNGEEIESASLDFAPLIPRPDKVLAVGLNYSDHLAETGRPEPQYPTIFTKLSSCLLGANDPIDLGVPGLNMDWEVELAVIIGTTVRNASPEQARAAIAGFSILNDVTARALQTRTPQWTQGKIQDRSCPFGPYLLVTDATPDWSIECQINGLTKQQSMTSQLSHTVTDLIAYMSQLCTLVPGDVIATGTPGGVGSFRTPPEYLAPGDEVISRIEQLGSCRNLCVAGAGAEGLA